MKLIKPVCVVVVAGAVGTAMLVLAEPPPPSSQTEKPAPAGEPTPPAAPAAAEPLKPISRVEKENGLIIEELVIGEGPECPPNTCVVAHYRGTFKSDGREFDSSYGQGEPAPFPLRNVIAGWQQGVPGMKVGGKRRLTVPSALAYGEKGHPAGIPPNTDLVFEIEMVNFMQIEDLVVGEGAECKPGQTVQVYYRGTLKENGTQFGSNVGDPQPIEFRLQGLIVGWQEGIPGMKVGGKRKLTIPWQFAYGAQGRPPRIPPKADLVFEIELVGVK